MLKLYNTLSGKVEEFRPLKGKSVGIYTCGPTVYDYAHIGNLRTFTFQDMMVKYLKFKGFKVKHVMNLTDVDDKTIRGSQQESTSLNKFTDRYTKEFFNGLQSLNIRKADKIIPATKNINEMVKLVEKLLKKGIAYRSSDGSIYFSIKKFPEYGRLSKLKLKKLKVGARVSQDEYEKTQANDFALWKAWTEKDGKVFWDTRLGKGRPGWHLECSSISMSSLGESFDIHSGGIDLVFPHHENEIAQSEAASGKKFVKYWVHVHHLIVDGKKMSKSLGNFFTLRDLKEHSPRALRYLFLSAHYRSELNFTLKSLEDAENVVEKFDEFTRKLQSSNGVSSGYLEDLLQKARAGFEHAMDNDLNVPLALASVFEFLREVNSLMEKNSLSRKEAEKIASFLKEIDSVLGVLRFRFKEELGPELLELIEKREEFRKARRFGEADKLRAELLGKGIQLDDTQKGVKWKRIKT